MDIVDYINSLSVQGRHSFSLVEALADTGKSHKAVTVALGRQIKKNRIALPYRGFYLILPPTHQRYRCLPAEYWIDDLMQYLKKSYCVCLLSAAKYYAAAHQKPQTFQVMVEKIIRPIQCGDVYVEFIKNDKLKLTPVKKFNTPSGYIHVETSEALMIDLLRYPLRVGGLNNIATIFTELAEVINEDKLTNLFTAMQVEQITLQRSGYLLELIGSEKLACVVEQYLQTRVLRTRALVSGIKTKGCPRSKRWNLYINYEVESDL